MYVVLAQLFALFHFASSVSIPQNRRDRLPSLGRARFDARHVHGHKDIERRGTVETAETAYLEGSNWYQCTVGVGDQSFTLQFDSGSVVLWIDGPETEPEIGDQHTFYEPSSSASQVNGLTWSQAYDIGSASGVVYTDTVTFGDITLHNYPVAVATTTDFVDPGLDGILGVSLGVNGVSPDGIPTFLNSVYGLLEEPVFTAKLTRPGENAGFYTFGYIDDTLGGQTIQWAPVVPTNDQGYWAFPSTIANIGGNIVYPPADNIAFADTGTTLIFLNEAVLNEIYRLLEGTCDTTGLGDTPCIFPKNAQVPSITLYVQDHGVTLNPEDLVWKEYSEDYYVGSVQPRTGSYDVFGDYFLRNVYAVFDFTNGSPQFGFVPRAPET